VSVHRQSGTLWRKGITVLQNSQSLQLFSLRAVSFVDEVMLGVNERKA